jgi:hypothetical protein
MLKIGTSKMGSIVDCPRCHKLVVVPPQSTPQAEELYQLLKSKRASGTAPSPAATPTITEPSAPESAWDELGGNVDDAELNRWIDELWQKTSGNPQETSAILLPLSIPNPISNEEVALLALQKQYKLTRTLLYVLTTVAFVLGIVFGISIDTFFVQPSRPQQHLAEESVNINEVTGTLYYFNENGERRADVDAVIICLRKDRLPSPLFSCQGLRPEDTVNNDTAQLIHELGGTYTRADAHGSFTLQYQDGVRYFVILISAHHMQPGDALKASVLQELRRYFHNPELLNEHCLSTDEYEWSGGKHSLRHTFESTE